MSACEIEDCERPKRKRGWCEMHYSRWRAHGSPLVSKRRTQELECSEPDCDRRPLARDLCRRHYYAALRGTKTLPVAPAPPPKPCKIDGCEAVSACRGWCGAHYQRWRRFGDPEHFPVISKGRCSIDGCDQVTNARGLCGQHYYRWQRYGDPLVSKNSARVTTARRYQPRACVACGAMFDPGTSSARKYCGRACRPARSSVGVNTRATVERLGERDGWTCSLCRLPIDPSLYWPNTQAGSVDHRLAVARGGTDDASNLWLTHLGCNIAKGAR